MLWYDRKHLVHRYTYLPDWATQGVSHRTFLTTISSFSLIFNTSSLIFKIGTSKHIFDIYWFGSEPKDKTKGISKNKTRGNPLLCMCKDTRISLTGPRLGLACSTATTARLQPSLVIIWPSHVHILPYKQKWIKKKYTEIDFADIKVAGHPPLNKTSFFTRKVSHPCLTPKITAPPTVGEGQTRRFDVLGIWQAISLLAIQLNFFMTGLSNKSTQSLKIQ